jgi:hypothetical protein
MILPDLSPEHLAALHASAISDEVVAARGYRTITATDELEAFGFAPYQRRVPGLLIPLHSTDGSNGLNVYRPDNPRVIEQKKKPKNPDGTYPNRVVKYEIPKGVGVRVDCPPMCRADLKNPNVRIWVTEGIKKSDALASVGECAIALLGVWGFKGKNEFGGTTLLADLDYVALDNRDACIVYDSDVTSNRQVQQALDRLAEHLGRKKAKVSHVHLPSKPDGSKQGVDDFLAAGHTLQELEALVQQPQRVETRPPSQATRLIDLGCAANLFHTPDGESFATFAMGGHLETWPLRSKMFKRWLARSFYEKARTVPSAQALQDALQVMEGKALYDGLERPVFTRLAQFGNSIFLDLTNQNWEAVEITGAGWRIVSDPPVPFRRARGMLGLPHPLSGGTLDDLREFVNIASSDDWKLLISWLVGCMRPDGPYPVLVVHGGQGSAKSTLIREGRSLVDPNSAPLRSEPREVRDLMIAAKNGWVTAFDNISYLPDWLSDAICRLATGGGFATRELYSDDEEVLFEAQRPVAFNGIEELAVRGDLLDRSVMLYLPELPDDKRKDEKRLAADFMERRPKILGALLDATCAAIQNLPTLEISHLPRMADFALWSVAASSALGWGGEDFLEAYAGNRRETNRLPLEVSPIADTLIEIAEHGKWTGTATRLLSTLNAKLDEKVQRQKAYPKSPAALSNALRRLAANLKAVGVQVAFEREGGSGTRLIVLEKVGISSSQASHGVTARDDSLKTAAARDEGVATRDDANNRQDDERVGFVTTRDDGDEESHAISIVQLQESQPIAIAAGKRASVSLSEIRDFQIADPGAMRNEPVEDILDRGGSWEEGEL